MVIRLIIRLNLLVQGRQEIPNALLSSFVSIGDR
jgi:hypothetical protein